MEAAAQILEREGPDGFNTAAVAERAGVSIGTLYQYFPDKQAILVAAARREVDAGEPARSGRQRALMRALIAVLESVGRLTGAAPATPTRPRLAKAAPPNRRGVEQRVLEWRDDGVALCQRLLAGLAVTRAVAPVPACVRARR